MNRYTYRWGFVWRVPEPGELRWWEKLRNLFRRKKYTLVELCFPAEWLNDILQPSRVNSQLRGSRFHNNF
jgi:hypothetical protein